MVPPLDYVVPPVRFSWVVRYQSWVKCGVALAIGWGFAMLVSAFFGWLNPPTGILLDLLRWIVFLVLTVLSIGAGAILVFLSVYLVDLQIEKLAGPHRGQ